MGLAGVFGGYRGARGVDGHSADGVAFHSFHYGVDVKGVQSARTLGGGERLLARHAYSPGTIHRAPTKNIADWRPSGVAEIRPASAKAPIGRLVVPNTEHSWRGLRIFAWNVEYGRNGGVREHEWL